MLLAELVRTSAAVAATRKRLEKRALLCERLRACAPDEVGLATAWLTGTLRQGRIGLGPALVREAWRQPAATASSLSLAGVDRRIDDIAATRGKGSAGTRRRLLGELFAAAADSEQDFLARLLLGELRQGALEGVMADAIAEAAALPPDAVRRAVMLAGDAAVVADAALREGAGGLARFRLEPGRPLQAMLAQPADSAADALAALGEAALEYKMDGARVQIHKAGDEVRVFSRRLRDVTASVPEIVEQIGALPAGRLILDGETLALREDGRPHPFQVTMRRFGRRLDVESLRATLPLSVFAFDCLHLDGEDLIDAASRRRFEALADALPPPLRIPRRITGDAGDAEAFLDEALAAGHEGLMAKSLEAPYAAGSRGAGWLKIKPAHTLDLVVLAAEWGSGRRRGWLSNLHLGARAEDGGFVMLGKTFKGLTDATLQWQTERLLALEVAREAHVVHVRPELVVEIAFNELQESPHYPGGLALRFARVKRYREDKAASQADTISTVRAIHARGRR